MGRSNRAAVRVGATVRTATAFLCFSLLFPAALAADPAPLSPTDTYIWARDRYIAEFSTGDQYEALFENHQQALAGLKRQITDLIPPWKPTGFPDKGHMSGSTTVLVTTVPLVERWLKDHHRLPNPRELMRCFIANVGRTPEWKSLVSQAQSLADLLH